MHRPPEGSLPDPFARLSFRTGGAYVFESAHKLAVCAGPAPSKAALPTKLRELAKPMRRVTPA